jgi:hypothetical protein
MAMRNWFLLSIFIVTTAARSYAAPDAGFKELHPRPTGYAESGAVSDGPKLSFSSADEFAGVTYDIKAEFPKGDGPAFIVDKVLVNGSPAKDFVVSNEGAFSGGKLVHATEDFSIGVFANWTPNTKYEIKVEGKAESGERIQLAAADTAPERRGKAGISFQSPSEEFPYHYVTLRIPKEIAEPGKVKLVEIDGKKWRDARFFNSGKKHPAKTASGGEVEGESYDGIVEGSRDFRVTAPLSWQNNSTHKMRVVVTTDAGADQVFEDEGSAPGSGGQWSADWPHSASLIVEETAGLPREQEPVHVMVGVFADDITKPENEIRVITLDPTHPKAGQDGWLVAPAQVTNVTVWRDERLLKSEEKDPESGALVHRYDATTTVELVFYADVAAYEKKIYLIVYGNPNATKQEVTGDLKVTKGDRLSQTVENGSYSYFLSVNSGSVETITIRGDGEPVVLEHKLETNGAIHWNPDLYSPPTPWVHISDWETPIYNQITGPLFHRTRRYAPLPHMDSANASVSYSFYANKPYLLISSYMEVNKDMFVQALRNAEVVFNHATLKEFVWQNALGQLQTMDVESARKHPIHALEIPADTPWMALVNREKKVGFASIQLAYLNGNKFGQPPSEAQPYFYVQNGPWVYWSRPIVYPFGGNNFTRMMPVRAGSFYADTNAWIPFRFAKGDDPFADIKRFQKQLTNPLRVHEWAATDDRTPETWVMPILTMPFDEGVAGAVSGHKDASKDEKEKKE